MWFFIAALICGVIDIEQVTVTDFNHPEAAVWPPQAVIEVIHWWGRSCDPALVERSPAYQFLIWIDVFYYLPFYLAGIYAVWYARPWLRDQLMLQSASIITGTSAILFVNLLGPNRSPNPTVLLSGYLSYIIVPFLCIVYCMSTRDFFHGRVRAGSEAATKKSK